MRLNKLILAGISICIYNISYANIEGFSDGIRCGGDFRSRPESEKEIIKKIGVTFSTNKVDSGTSCLAWSGSNNNWYELSKDLKIYGVNVETKQYLGNWPLSQWEYYSQPTEILEREVDWETSTESYINGAKYPLGCLSDVPLRYGDFETDTKNELVIFLGNDLVVFSPEQGKTIFSTWLSLGDWFTLDDGAWYFQNDNGDDIKKPTDPQYESRLIHNKGPQEAHAPGIRGYGKIYIGDFDNNQKKDVIVWQKIYQSKLEEDTNKGFDLLRDQYTHFEQGHNANNSLEFIPQDNTAPETIEGWLTAKNLTWQKGFPSKSECAGQEGQLIPEMHDPLLNDLDVLK